MELTHKELIEALARGIAVSAGPGHIREHITVVDSTTGPRGTFDVTISAMSEAQVRNLWILPEDRRKP